MKSPLNIFQIYLKYIFLSKYQQYSGALQGEFSLSRTEDAEDAETTQTHRHSMPGALAPVAWNLPGVMDFSWAPSPFFVGAMQ